MYLFIGKKFIDMTKNPRDIHRINIGIATSNFKQILGDASGNQSSELTWCTGFCTGTGFYTI